MTFLHNRSWILYVSYYFLVYWAHREVIKAVI